MENWTIGKRISLGFAGLIFITLALGAFAYSRLLVINTHSNQITKESLPAIELVYQLEKNAKDAALIVYKNIGCTNAELLAHLDGALAETISDSSKAYDELGKLTMNPAGRALMEEVQNQRANNSKIRKELLSLSRQSTNSVQTYALAHDVFDPANQRYLAAMEAFVDFAKTNADGAAAGIQAGVESSKAGILAGLGLAAVFGMGVAFVIVRGTSGTLRRFCHSLNEGANQVASAANQVSTSSQSLAQGSGEQAASIEETSSSLEEMASMTKRNAENAQKANALAKQARTAADAGASDMKNMSAAMEAIKVSSDDISKIIKTIDEIAFQTNILALNAAVEAARAGEAGMGFAVVADEVRNLAQRSAQAAKETAGKIEDAINKTGQGVVINTKVAAVLDEIVSKVRQVDELVAEVASASREQTQGITQINTAVGQMDKVTQSNAATAEESAAAAEELNAQAEVMKRSVSVLLQLVGGESNSAASVSPSPAAGAELAKTTRTTMPAASRSASATGNGNASAHARSTKREEIPLDGDFKNF